MYFNTETETFGKEYVSDISKCCSGELHSRYIKILTGAILYEFES
jgi:hypothetical protein